MSVAGKTVLVTGANGFVGTRISRRLAGDGARIRALVRRPGELQEELDAPGIVKFGGDFTDAPTAAAAAEGADIVIHCAATPGKDLDDARRINTDGTRVVVEAAIDAGCERFIHISTVSVYDVEASAPVVDEDSPLTTTGHQYGISKAEADRVVFDAMRRGLNAVILRPSAILGVHPTSTWGVKVPRRVREGQIPLRIDGLDTFAYVHVENVVDATLLAIEDDRALGKAYNVDDGRTTWKAYTDEIRRWFDSPPLPVTPKEEVPPGSYWTGEYSSERIRIELGYRSRLTYEAGMAEAEAFWKAQG